MCVGGAVQVCACAFMSLCVCARVFVLTRVRACVCVCELCFDAFPDEGEGRGGAKKPCEHLSWHLSWPLRTYGP